MAFRVSHTVMQILSGFLIRDGPACGSQAVPLRPPVLSCDIGLKSVLC